MCPRYLEIKEPFELTQSLEITTAVFHTDSYRFILPFIFMLSELV